MMNPLRGIMVGGRRGHGVGAELSVVLPAFAVAILLVPSGLVSIGIASVLPEVRDKSSTSTIIHDVAKVSVSPSTGYSILFNERGLPPGWSWGVTFNGTYYVSGFGGGGTTVTINSVVNGTYTWNVSTIAGLTPTPSAGTVTVSGGPMSQWIAFATPPGLYTVTFKETGLPFGTAWGVTFNGSWRTFTSVTITFNEPNGTYPFNVSAQYSYSPNPYSGSVSVAGGAVEVNITFLQLLMVHPAFLGVAPERTYRPRTGRSGRVGRMNGSPLVPPWKESLLHQKNSHLWAWDFTPTEPGRTLLINAFTAGPSVVTQPDLRLSGSTESSRGFGQQ